MDFKDIEKLIISGHKEFGISIKERNLQNGNIINRIIILSYNGKDFLQLTYRHYQQRDLFFLLTHVLFMELYETYGDILYNQSFQAFYSTDNKDIFYCNKTSSRNKTFTLTTKQMSKIMKDIINMVYLWKMNV